MVEKERTMEAVMLELRKERGAKEEALKEKESIRSKLHSAVRKGKAIEAERSSLAEKLQSLMDAEQQRPPQIDFEEANQSLQEELRELQSRHQQTLAKLQSITALKGVASPERESRIVEEVHALKAEHHSAQQKVLEMQGELESLQGRLQHSHRESSPSSREEELQECVKSLESQLADSVAAMQASESAAANLQIKFDTVWQRCSELEQALESKQGSSSDQDTEDTHPADAEAVHARTNGNGNAAKEQVENLEQELKAARGREEEMRQTAAKLQFQLLALEEDSAKSLDGERRRTMAVREELRLAEENAEVMRDALQTAATRIQEAQDAESAAVATAEARDEEAAKLRKQLAEVEGTLSVQQNLEAELEARVQELRTSEGAAEELRARLDESKSAVRAGEERACLLEQQVAEVQAECARDLEESREAGHAAAEEAAQLREQAAEELATAREAKLAAERERESAEALQASVSQRVEAAEERAAAAEAAQAGMQAEEAARKQRFGFLHSTFAKEKADLLRQVEEVRGGVKLHREGLEEARQALSDKSQEALEALEEVGKLQRQCQGHTQQVEELERLLESAGEEVASVRQLREAGAESDRRTQDAEQRSAEVLEELQALRGQAQLGARLLEQATTKVTAGEVAVTDAHREISLLEQALQDARVEIGSIVPNGHAAKGPTQEVALEIDELELEQLRSENEALKERLAASSRRSPAPGQMQAQIAALEKQNRELQWQVSMLARDPEAPPMPPKQPQPQLPAIFQEVAGGEIVPRVVGLILRHRQGLLVAYFAALHILLYVLLQARGHACTVADQKSNFL